MIENQQYWTALLVSLVAAFLGWQAPTRRMPIDYEATIWLERSNRDWLGDDPCVLSVAPQEARILASCGSADALYWPVWLLFNHFPPCYYLHNCE